MREKKMATRLSTVRRTRSVTQEHQPDKSQEQQHQVETVVNNQPKKQQPSVSNSLVIAMSALSSEERVLMREAAQFFGDQLQETMSYETQILVAGCVLSEKYRLASDMGIPIVTSEWMKERRFSETKTAPDTAAYQLRLFEKCRIGLLNFSDQEEESRKQLINFIEERGGLCYNGLDKIEAQCTQQSLPENEKLKIVVVRGGNISENIQSFCASFRLWAVDETWLRACVERRTFVWPSHYVLCCRRTGTSERTVSTEALQRLRTELSALSMSDPLYQFFSGLVVHFYEGSSQNSTGTANQEGRAAGALSAAAKKLKNEKAFYSSIVACGQGLVCDFLLPCVTHVAVLGAPLTLQEEQSLRANRYGTLKIVHCDWLFQCFKSRRRLEEADYRPERAEPVANTRIAKAENHYALPPQLIRSLSLKRSQTSQEVGSDNSLSLNNFLAQKPLARQFSGTSPLSLDSAMSYTENVPHKQVKSATLHNNSSSSMQTAAADFYKVNSLMRQQSTTSSSSANGLQKQSSVLKGSLFKGYIFVFRMQDKQSQEKYIKLVRSQEGTYNDKLESDKLQFFVLDDSPKNQSHYLNIQNCQLNRNFLRVQIVSHRWIDYCIERKMVVTNPFQRQLINLIPFVYETPFPEFKSLVIYFDHGRCMERSEVFSHIVKIIGAKWSFDSDTTHLVIGPEKSTIYAQVQANPQQYSNLCVVSTQWLEACLQQGKRVPEKDYLIGPGNRVKKQD